MSQNLLCSKTCLRTMCYMQIPCFSYVCDYLATLLGVQDLRWNPGTLQWKL